MDGWKGHRSRRVGLVFFWSRKRKENKMLMYLDGTEDGYLEGTPEEKVVLRAT